MWIQCVLPVRWVYIKRTWCICMVGGLKKKIFSFTPLTTSLSKSFKKHHTKRELHDLQHIFLKKCKKICSCDGFEPSFIFNLLAGLGIEPRLKRACMLQQMLYHNVTCYHYTIPPRLAEGDHIGWSIRGGWTVNPLYVLSLIVTWRHFNWRWHVFSSFPDAFGCWRIRGCLEEQKWFQLQEYTWCCSKIFYNTGDQGWKW